MDQQLQVFQNDQFGEIRTVVRDGEPWFVAADVCRALELDQVTNAVRKLDDDEKALISIKGISRGNDVANCVNEPGLYTLVLGSRKPEARAFRRWVTHDVLPAIRKTGAYLTPAIQQQVASLADRVAHLEHALNAITADTDAEVQRVRDHNANVLKEVYGVHANFVANPARIPRKNPDMLESGLTTLEETASIIGISAVTFREFLCREGYIYLSHFGNVYLPFPDTNHGFFELRDTDCSWSSVQFFITRTGRRFFLDLLRPSV